MGLGKLDNLSPLELECYQEWSSADHTGGDCDTIGYAWCAWDEDRVIITEDSYGFVRADTYDATNGTGEVAYTRRLDALIERDNAFYAEQEEQEERTKALSEAQEHLVELLEEDKGPCDSCNKVFASSGGISGNIHELGCPRMAAIKAQEKLIASLED